MTKMDVAVDLGMSMAFIVTGIVVATAIVGIGLVAVYMITNRGTYMEIVRDNQGRIVQIIERNFAGPGGLVLNNSVLPMVGQSENVPVIRLEQ